MINRIEKWIVLISGIIIQMVLGGVYAWSFFTPSLTADYGLSNAQAGFIFGKIIAVFTISMIFGGYCLQKYGPRITSAIGALLFSLGYFVASKSNGDYYTLLTGLSVISGIGIGFGYVCPLTVGMKWFPNNKGLITGISVAGFGGGAILLTSMAEYLVSQGMNVMEIFFIISTRLGLAAFICALLMSEPKSNNKASSKNKSSSVRDYLKKKSFWFYCFGIFAGTFAGLLVVGNLKPLMVSVGLSEKYALLSISIFALGNIIGRTLWGEIHDILGSRKTILCLLAFLGLSLPLLLVNILDEMVLATVLMVGIGFGGCFVVFASSVVSSFGIDMFPKLYPLCFLWYGFAGLKGPTIGGVIKDITGNYNSAVLISSAIVLVTLIIYYAKFEEEKLVEA